MLLFFSSRWTRSAAQLAKSNHEPHAGFTRCVPDVPSEYSLCRENTRVRPNQGHFIFLALGKNVFLQRLFSILHHAEDFPMLSVVCSFWWEETRPRRVTKKKWKFSFGLFDWIKKEINWIANGRWLGNCCDRGGKSGQRRCVTSASPQAQSETSSSEANECATAKFGRIVFSRIVA